MAVTNLKRAALDALAAAIAAHLTTRGATGLAANCTSGEDDWEGEEAFPSLRVVASDMRFAPASNDEEVDATQDNILVADVGSYDGTAELRLGFRSPAEREALEPLVSDLFHQTEDARGQVTVEIHGGYAAGSIVAIAKAALIDGETFTLDDGTNTPTVFEFDKTGDGVTGGRTAVNVSTDTTDAEVAARMRSAINGVGASLTIVASGTGSAVALANTTAGSDGNVAITDTVANAGFTHTGMTGGGVQLPGGATAYRPRVTFSLSEDDWIEERVFEKRRYSSLLLDVSLPVLVLRDVVGDMDTLILAFTDNLTADPEDLTTEDVAVDEDGNLTQA